MRRRVRSGPAWVPARTRRDTHPRIRRPARAGRGVHPPSRRVRVCGSWSSVSWLGPSFSHTRRGWPTVTGGRLSEGRIAPCVVFDRVRSSPFNTEFSSLVRDKIANHNPHGKEIRRKSPKINQLWAGVPPNRWGKCSAFGWKIVAQVLPGAGGVLSYQTDIGFRGRS